MPVPHPYAHVLNIVASGDTVQACCAPDKIDDWLDQDADDVLHLITLGQIEPNQFRAKPKKIVVNGHTVYAPMEHPQPVFYYLDFTMKNCIIRGEWGDDEVCRMMLERGNLYASEIGALQYAAAIGFDKSKTFI